MKKIVFIVIVSINIVISLRAQNVKNEDNTLTDSLYVNYNSKEFLMLKKLDEPIDFEKPDILLLNTAIFHLTNKEREKKKRSKLIFSAELGKAAQFHSEQMRDNNFYSHENVKDKEFYSMDDRIKYFGGNFRWRGENISKKLAEKEVKQQGGKLLSIPLTYGELAEKIVYSWMDSPGHRANILDLDYKFLGCGVALPVNPSERKEYIYALSTQDFGG